MANRVGVWIEHANARIVTLNDESEPKLTRIESDVPAQHKGLHEGHPRVGPGQENLPGPHGKDERFRQSMIDRHFAKVIDALRGAERVAIFGPDPTRTEFEKALRAERRQAPEVHAVIGADRQTDAQFVATVREVFGVPAPRMVPSRRHV